MTIQVHSLITSTSLTITHCSSRSQLIIKAPAYAGALLFSDYHYLALMKSKTLLSLLIASTALLSSCHSSNSSLLPGKWNCVSLVMKSTDETGASNSTDYMKASQCDKPNALAYIFDEKEKVTENDFFSCKEASYEGSYKWLNEEKDLELTQGERKTVLRIVTLSKDSLVMTTGDEKNPLVVKMARGK
jgi:hypothetical protein